MSNTAVSEMYMAHLVEHENRRYTSATTTPFWYISWCLGRFSAFTKSSLLLCRILKVRKASRSNNFICADLIARPASVPSLSSNKRVSENGMSPSSIFCV